MRELTKFFSFFCMFCLKNAKNIKILLAFSKVQCYNILVCEMDGPLPQPVQKRYFPELHGVSALPGPSFLPLLSLPQPLRLPAVSWLFLWNIPLSGKVCLFPSILFSLPLQEDTQRSWKYPQYAAIRDRLCFPCPYN